MNSSFFYTNCIESESKVSSILRTSEYRGRISSQYVKEGVSQKRKDYMDYPVFDQKCVYTQKDIGELLGIGEKLAYKLLL